MVPRRVIGLGASAGGVEALAELVAHLPPRLPAAVLVTLHVSPVGTSVLDQILDRAGPLPAAIAVDGEALTAGRIYVAPADRHLVAAGGVVHTTRGPKEHGHRPAIDPLLRSIADCYGPAGVGVVLSGMRDDGAAGLERVKAAGGIALAQDPGDARFPGMPVSAAEHVVLDGCLSAAALGAELGRLANDGAALAEGVS